MRRWRVGSGLLALGMVLSACGDDGGSAAGDQASGGPDSSATTAAAGDDEGGSREIDVSIPIRYGFVIPAEQWDPHRGANQVSETPYLALVYDRLLQVDHDGVVQPMLASDFELSDDGTTVTLTIRDGVTFHDGASLDAQVVVDNLERARTHPGSTVASQLAGITAIEASGPNEVTLTVAEPDPLLLLVLTTTTGAIISPAALDDPGLQQAPVGAGPYVPVSIEPGRVVYELFPDYWDTTAVLPERREIVALPDSNAQFNALSSGTVDFIAVAGDGLGQAREFAATGDFELQEYLTAETITLFLNAGMPPLDDIDVRRAISLAIDRETIAEAVDGACAATNQVFPPSVPTFQDEFPVAESFDPDAARELLNGREITIQGLQSAFEPHASVGLIVQQMLADVGVTLSLENVEPRAASPTWLEGNSMALVHQTSLRNSDLSTVLDFAAGSYNPGGAPTDLAEAAATARLLPNGSDERTEAYRELSGYLVENPIHIPICSRPSLFLARNGLVGVDQLPDNGITSSTDTRVVAAVE